MRSIHELSDVYKNIVKSADSHIETYIFFEGPMLNAEQVNQLVSESWKGVQEKSSTSMRQTRRVEGHICEPYTLLNWILDY